MSTAEILQQKDRSRRRYRLLGLRELQKAKEALASDGRLDLFATELGYRDRKSVV